ncbi:hypothetical protein HRW16_09695 [Streptomyces lunaelactis]|uniref:HEPN domain-containing protein n=1 Tax=Streptomyces lunaelactis TaxID=1535768 RepID=UPI00158566DA|nr:HEPN domain-containing protein [Streptomyces lunaelactis]NUK35067.1 hypothetical protein [Streptomyces lunaelactis]NUK44660.1 hypothetical protein [Streptomyces lunaelactis]NUK92126.1 hypothetical protein [Streptomyces lunaelactis]NUL29897.1 hypothetical protein [Streptomyces lunaelactis]
MDPVSSLRNDIDELKNSLLDEEVLAVSPPDDLCRRHQLLIASFVILSHAHIEEFIEGLFLRYVEEREREISNRETPQCFVRLALHFSGDLIGQGAGKYDIEQICTTAKNLYISKVVNINNGLKRANVTALAKPLGLHGEKLADDCNHLFTALNTLGGKRGKMAHTSSSQSASETVYSTQAIAWVEDAVNRIHELVDYLQPVQ